MSVETKIEDRPLPFAVKTAILQLVGMAIGTPNEVADMSVKVDCIINMTVNVRIYPGGYSNGVDAFDETAYLNGSETDVIKRLDELIASVNKTLADGRRVRLERVKKQAAALLAEAQEIEATLAKMDAVTT